MLQVTNYSIEEITQHLENIESPSKKRRYSVEIEDTSVSQDLKLSDDVSMDIDEQNIEKDIVEKAL